LALVIALPSDGGAIPNPSNDRRTSGLKLLPPGEGLFSSKLLFLFLKKGI
jgi:hypothetical protein